MNDKIKDAQFHFLDEGGIVTMPAPEGDEQSLKKPSGVQEPLAHIEEVKVQPVIDSYKELFAETETQLKLGGWSWDPATQMATWTSGIYKLLGYTEDEVGTNIPRGFFLSHVVNGDKEILANMFHEAATLRKGFEHEYVVQTKTGEHKIVYSKGNIIEDPATGSFKIIGITRDITEIRNLEKQRERSLHDLNRSNKELEEFAYVASHDLQEPLRKISMFSERLRNKLTTLDKESGLFLDRILVATNNMKTLIDNLLEFSRANRSSKGFTRMNLSDSISQVLSDLELKIEESRCKVNIVNPLPVIEAGPSEMIQLFTNLLSNAIKFRKSDVDCTIDITVKKLTKDDKNLHNLPLNKIYYKINVTDNGIGFEEEYSTRIFQIFQRLHGKSEYPGSGIGLAICKKIVDNHNGLIYAHSVPGDGATFSIILPEKQF